MNRFIVATFVILALVLTAPVMAETSETEVLVTEETSDGWKLHSSGYAQEWFSSSTDELTNDRTRLKFSLEGETPCGFHAEFDISGARRSHRELKESNWLQKAWASCRLSPETTLDFGRIFPESGFSTFWPGGIITARYPGMYPWSGYYAYGVSVRHSVSERWSFSGTVSGRSDLQFDDQVEKQFDHLELAGRAKRSFDLGYLGFTTQASDEFFHAGVDFGWKTPNLEMQGGVFYSDVDNSPLSGFGQVEWFTTKRVAVHLLAEERTSGEAVVTTGLGVRWKGFYLVGDYEMNLETDEESFLAGLRYNW